MNYKLLDGTVVDLDTITYIGSIGGFGGNSICRWTGYVYRTMFSDNIGVTISCLPNQADFDIILAKVEKEADFIKQYMVNKNPKNSLLERCVDKAIAMHCTQTAIRVSSAVILEEAKKLYDEIIKTNPNDV